MRFASNPLLAVAHGAVLAVVDPLAVGQGREPGGHPPGAAVEEVPLPGDARFPVN